MLRELAAAFLDVRDRPVCSGFSTGRPNCWEQFLRWSGDGCWGPEQLPIERLPGIFPWPSGG